MISIAHPEIGEEERENVMQVMASGQLAQGKWVAAFEQQFAEFMHAKEGIAVSSGTSALHLSLLAHGVKAGDEVITSPFSFAATANVICVIGAKPVFVDIDPLSYNIDVTKIEAAITPRTKAIMPVHLFGNPCDITALMDIAKTHNLAVVEDACQSHAATVDGKYVGTFGTGCFSFYPTKNMTTGEGGIVITDDSAIADRIRLMRNHGQRERYKQIAMGYNLRMTEIQAAIGVAQLKKLPRFTQKRQSNAAYLDDQLQSVIQTPTKQPNHQHVYHQYTIRIPAHLDREQIRQTLKDRGIGTEIYYPRSIHQQPYFIENNMTASCPNAEEASLQVLSLPIHPDVSEKDLALIAEEVKMICR